MNVLSEIKSRFRFVLADFVDQPDVLLEMIRPSQDSKFGDYQANCAMPLGKQLGKPPREIAAQIVEKLDVADICGEVSIAGPGFINLRLKDEWLIEQLTAAIDDPRLGVLPAKHPRTFVIDYSSPNVAKPMHVGHIRSTVIGYALCRMLRFAGHHVISDNHLGDWGTQFGMIIYGYKHFRDEQAYRQQPVAELGRLYKLVNQLVEYHEGQRRLPELERKVAQREEDLAAQRMSADSSDKADRKHAAKTIRKLEGQLAEARADLTAVREKIRAVDADPRLSALAREHSHIAGAVLEETAKLHAEDPENLRLWHEFLPHCRKEIQRIYDRIGVSFDYEYGESFYHDRLAAVVRDFRERKLARESEGATCVFLDGFDTPMIIRKKDGAYLYATTDLATIQYRLVTWRPDALLYVVDHRQSEHFAKLFAAARCWGYRDIELQHISFGTVLGDDGRPFRTRAGETVGLEGLLDEAVRKARAVVSQNDDAKPNGPELSAQERQRIAEVVGIGALKYADLSQNRTSDYVFSYDKMLALNGNTATYMQYSYARVQGIFSRGEVELDALRKKPALNISHPAERALGLAILRFSEALDESLTDYRPNQLTNYLFEFTQTYFTFYEQCRVLQAENERLRNSRLLLCDLTGRTIKQGLAILGIDVLDKM
jgi:arginyl-tRNA synthetase